MDGVPGATRLRLIVHADLDAFYASVEQLDNPDLRGQPVIVGGTSDGRGVVMACSYEARAFGVHSAMPARTALQLCPEAIAVPPRFHRYHELSTEVMAMLGEVSPALEQVSIDEAYLDVSDAWEPAAAEASARMLKLRVREELGLVISLGVAGTKSAAKIASDLGKPDGLVVVTPGTESGFLAPLPVRRLGGIGPRTEERLRKLGVETLGDLAAQDDRRLLTLLGSRGPWLGRMSRGVDAREVVTGREAKSVSAERTFPTDVADPQALRLAVQRLSERVGERLQHAGARGRTVTLKLRLADFTTYSRSATVAFPIGDGAALATAARGILARELARRRGRYRLLGVEVSGFVAGEQLRLPEG